MSDNLTDTAESLVLNWINGVGSPTRPTTPLKVKLMTANGSDSSAGTELGTSGGYTAGGISVTFTSSSSGSAATNNADLTWTNMPATTIVGVEVWDTAGSPVRIWYGALSSSKTTNSGDTFTISNGSLSVSAS
jgi:hypothetical protein